MPAKTKLPKNNFAVMSSYPVYAGDNGSSAGSCETEIKHIMLYTPLTVWMNVQLSVKLLLGCTLH